jgi:diguanylate cyclase
MPSSKQLLDVIAIQTEIIKLGLDLGEVLAIAVDRTLGLIDADGAVIELAEGEDMVYRAVAGIAKPHFGLRLKQVGSLSGACVHAGEILRCDDSENDPRVNREACRQVGLRSMIVMPLRHGDQTIGVLKAMSSAPAKFAPSDEVLLGLLSESIAAAMYFATQLGNDDLFHKATHDPLTGLANRSLFMDRLRNVVSRKQRSDAPAGVLMLDMDGLKRVNDNYGHRAGDAILCEFANRINTSSRQSDTVARLGGDEFAILLQPIDDVSQGIHAAIRRLEQRIAPPFEYEGRPFSLQASIGAASFPADCDNVDGLLELADRRMYAVKNQHHRQAG